MRGAALLLLFALALPAAAADAPGPPPDVYDWAARVAAGAAETLAAAGEVADEDRVRRLVARLGSADYREREAAGKQLAREPDRALPALRQALRTLDDPEAARRLEVLIRKLHTERLAAPKRVTFAGDKVPVKDLLAEITRQTGYKLTPAGLGESEKARLSVAWSDTPFWQAVDDVCHRTGLQVSPDGDDEAVLSVSDNDTYNPHVSYSGPFRFVATNIGTNRNLQLAGLPRKFPPPRPPEFLNLNFQIQSEPKNPIVSFHPPELIRAVDDTGANLVPPRDDDQARSYYAPYMYRGFNQYAGLNLARGGRAATVIKELRGRVTIFLLSDTRPEIVVENVLGVKKKKFVGRTTELEIESVSEGGGGVSVVLTARQLNPTPDDYSWANSVYQRLELWDDAGVKWTGNVTGNNQANTPGAATLTLTYTPPAGNKRAGKPSRFQFVEWLTHPRDVEFVFKDIPLP